MSIERTRFRKTKGTMHCRRSTPSGFSFDTVALAVFVVSLVVATPDRLLAASPPAPLFGDASGEESEVRLSSRSTASGARTLILWNSARISSQYSPAAALSLASMLAELAGHGGVAGAVLDLAGVPEVQSAMACWDDCRWNGDTCASSCLAPDPQLRANAAAGAIRTWLHGQINGTYTSTASLVLVGDDVQIPFYRLADGTSIHPESRYPAEVGLSTATTVGSALAAGMFLTDNYYAELSPEPSGMAAPHDRVFLNDFATGRLVETPAQIESVIIAFLVQDGQLSVASPSARILVAGYDFLFDSALGEKGTWVGSKGASSVDCLLHDPGLAWPGDPMCPDTSYSSSDLLGQLMSASPHELAVVNTVGSHFGWTTPNGSLSTSDLDASPFLLPGTVLYGSGCHAGLPVPPTDSHPLDFPEEMAKKKVVACVGNTGYGWGFRHGTGLTERLVEQLTAELTTPDSIPIGWALAKAKRALFMQQPRYDVFDEKVLHQMTLFGIPNYLLVTREAPVAEKEPAAQLPVAGEAVGRECADGDGVRLGTRLRDAGVAAGLPPGMIQLDLDYTFEAGAHEAVTTPDGTWYELNGVSAGEVGDAIQPVVVQSAHLSLAPSHGVMLAGGSYTAITPFDPVIAVPRSSNPPTPEGALSPVGAPAPVLVGSFAIDGAWLTREGASAAAVPQVGHTNLVAHSGFYDPAPPGTESLFDDMQLSIFYTNSTDVTPPAVVDPATEVPPRAGFHVLAGLVAGFSAEVSDLGAGAAGVWRVVVTHDDTRSNEWRSLDLSFDPGSGKWEGSLALKGRITYYVQAVDNAGNVGMLTTSGADRDAGLEPYGSTWTRPKSFEIVLPDGDADGLPDPWEDLHPTTTLGGPCLDRLVGGQAGLDPDDDGLTSDQELDLDTDPCNGDSDRGGDNDGSESNNGRTPHDPSDDLPIAIRVTKGKRGAVIDWPAGIESNGVIDGSWFVYRSIRPAFAPADRISALPIPNETRTFSDAGESCELCFYGVTNVAIATPPPTVGAVVPLKGTSAGGTAVRTYGTGFSDGAVVRFCGVPATGVIVVNDTVIDCVTPANPVGSCDVTVTNLDGQEGSLPGGFTYE